MTAITKVGNPTLATLTPPHNTEVPTATAYEDIAPGDACYIRSDGTIALALDANSARKEVDGYAPSRFKAGRAATLLHTVIFGYGSGLTPGASVFLSATVPGGLDTTVGTYQTKPLGVVQPDGTTIRLVPTR